MLDDRAQTTASRIVKTGMYISRQDIADSVNADSNDTGWTIRFADLTTLSITCFRVGSVT